MKTTLCLCVALAATAASLFAADKQPLTNADVIKMVRAELPESTIVLAIRNSAPAFDTSPDALIELKTSGVGPAVIEAMLAPPAAAVPAPAAPAPSAPAAASTLALPPGIAGFWGSKLTRIDADRVFLLSGERREDMKYTRPGTRTRANPFGGLQQFAVLGGTRALLRLSDPKPTFEMILPNNVQPTSVLALGLLGERKNGTREILIAGGYLAFSAGLPRDRNIAIHVNKAPDQSAAPDGFEVYHVSPADPLKAGEYAFMVAKQSTGDMAFAGAGMNYNFYEFAVD